VVFAQAVVAWVLLDVRYSDFLRISSLVIRHCGMSFAAMNASTAKSFDVLGLGCAAVDDLLYVPSFPLADKKVRAAPGLRRCGGLTGTAIVTAARLGARCAYAGCLGTDEYSQHVASNFTSEGVDISHAPRLAAARVVHSTIVVGKDCGSRNVFFEDQGTIGAHDSLPSEEVIRQSKVLFIDHLGMQGNLRAVRAARSAGVAVVADFEDDSSPLFPAVLKLVDHLVLSEDFALRITRQSSAAEAALALWEPNRVAVLVTCGARGCWSVSAKSGSQAFPHAAFPISAADTTGCGDVFHGAYSASLAFGDPLRERIRFAAAAAALKAMHGEIPHLPAVKEFLQAQLRTAPAT
jgi:sugar/nucleoside kinase (ribokinase family)